MKHNVKSWECVATYVAMFDADDGGESACDVEVCIGEDADGAWYVHTRDDAGGEDEADGTRYRTRDDAAAAASELACALDASDGAEDAADWERRKLQLACGETCDDGEWSCYFDSACIEDCGPRGRYATEDQATAAVDLANQQLQDANPGTQLLCGYEVRQLVDGEWLA